MLAQKLMSAMAGGSETLYVDDVFSAYTYTGNGSTQTINNGIDLAGKGGLVWLKGRDFAKTHNLIDTARGSSNILNSASTSAEFSLSTSITAFNGNGFTLGSRSETNAVDLDKYISWTFRKAPKFFDVVTYTGNGASNRSIAHSLGVAPGMVIIKRTDTGTNWCVSARMSNGTYRGGETTYAFGLNTNEPATTTSYSESAVGSSSAFLVGNAINGSAANTNANGASYVAYLFAHDTAADGIIQCGSCTVPGGSGVVAVNLGWEPQYVLFKQSGTSDWLIMDSSRGLAGSQELSSKTLAANSSTAESSGQWGSINATGFSTYAWNAGEAIYLAIRRPNKPPTTGTQVYNAVLQDANNVARTISGAGFAPDVLFQGRRQYANGTSVASRLTGKYFVGTSYTDAESSYAPTSTAFTMDGISYGASGDLNNNGLAVNWFFRRAPGFFDVVCYTGTGLARTVAHNLGAVPELMIVKWRTSNTGEYWYVYHAALGVNKCIFLQLPDAASNFSIVNSVAPTASVFTIDGGGRNTSNATYVAYLFASLPGVSKVGSYTGNGSSQTINCGFSAGARFILIKRTDAAGDWYVWDTARGIVSANDPHLSLNTTAAEVTSNDSVDPDSTGFIVNQNATTNINVTSATYLYLAIA